MKAVKIDKAFLLISLSLILGGFLIFTSAALGLVARNGARYFDVASNYILFGIILGGACMVFTSMREYRWWKRYSFFFYISSLLLTLSVFIPGLGMEHGGATRWLDIFGTSVQPAEFLKIGTIVYLAAWLSAVKEKISSFRHGVVPFLVIMTLTGIALLIQPDTDTFLVILAAGLAMLISAGARVKHIAIIAFMVIVGLVVLAFMRPYVMARIKTFFNPSDNPQSSGYQIQQSLIAIGSGQITGKGFGQSIQKFYFLPEPIGDSIFAVAAEEFGFIGSIFLIFLFTLFGLKGLRIAARAPDNFSGLLVVGIVILIISQSFVNIGSMLGVIPLSGLPLSFVSHGGTAMLVTLAEVGMILNISKYQKKI